MRDGMGSDYRYYDRNWLDGIRITQNLIETAPIEQVPIQYRAIIRQQWRAHVEAFQNDLSFGFRTTKSEQAILELATLAYDLVQDAQRG